MTTKKLVPCSNPDCCMRRVHYEYQDDMRTHRMVEVDKDYNGKSFCSITCACIAGYYDVKSGWIKDPAKE